jgi:hypothetical protein
VVVQREHVGLDAPTEIVTARTVKQMGNHILAAQSDPLLASAVFDAIGRNRTPSFMLSALWWWTKHLVRFVHDDDLIAHLLGEGDHFELLISPPVLLRMEKPEGDCDDFTMLICAMAKLCGFPIRIVTLACDRKRPGEYSHVYGASLLDRDLDSAERWMPLDVSHGKFPGWEVPAHDVQRKTMWDLSGQVRFDRWY